MASAPKPIMTYLTTTMPTLFLLSTAFSFGFLTFGAPPSAPVAPATALHQLPDQPEDGLFYDGDDDETMGELVRQACKRIGARGVTDAEEGDSLMHFDDSYLEIRVMSRGVDNLKVDALFVSTLIPLVPTAHADDPRLVEIVYRLNNLYKVGQVRIFALDQGEVILAIGRHLSFQDHLSDAFLYDWLVEFEGACDWLIQYERERIGMWLDPDFMGDPDDADDEDAGAANGDAADKEKGIDEARAEDTDPHRAGATATNQLGWRGESPDADVDDLNHADPAVTAVGDTAAFRAAINGPLGVAERGSFESAGVHVLPTGMPRVWDPEGPIVVRVVGEPYQCLYTPESVMQAWQTMEPVGGPGFEGISMAAVDDTGKPLIARTCQQWAEFGAEPLDNMNNKISQPIKVVDAILSWMMHARTSQASTLRHADVRSILLPLVPPPLEREVMKRTPDPINRVELRGNSLTRETEGWMEGAELLAFGDIDGDGWEDMLIERYNASMQGSFSETGIEAWTRLAAGRLVQLCDRVPQHMPSQQDWADRRRDWAANFGLPIAREVLLEGTCTCQLDDQGHDLSLRLVARHGIITGTKWCERHDHQVTVAGSLGAGVGVLHEYAIDDLPTASWEFDWTLKDGRLQFVGGRHAAGCMEADGFDATCEKVDGRGAGE